MKTLSKKEILILTLRTFFIRSFYNYKNLFGTGFCYCLLPIGKRSFCTEKNKNNFFERHFSFFNTNAYLSGFALGIAIRMEESEEYDKLAQIKNTLSGTLGAVGDNLVNNIILPLMVFSSLNMFILHGFSLTTLSFYFILSIVALFNIFNFSIRYYGISKGYSLGHRSLEIFKSKIYKTISQLLSFTRDMLAAFLLINLLTLIKLSTYNYLYLLNLTFIGILFSYIVKFLPAIYRELALVSTIGFYLIFYLF
ncbi:MAG: PTS system mannose/fructose/sorbose family transporter subunit IID [Candidatus Delongbacteria bacterium]|nr:PTS system mannose/fructose/sorbose family transporter subunit IID [Candidatus Delongbacteria bacterium]